MIEEKRIEETKRRVEHYLKDGVIKTKQPAEFIDFFLHNAENSLNSARCLYDLSTNQEYQRQTGYVGLKGFLWVINASYYSMFYMARALLATEGIKLRSDLSIHALTFDALVHFFYVNNKLQKQLFKLYAEAKEEAAELLGQQKANELIEDYFYERNKRSSLTYETGEYALQNKAKTSLDRATQFTKEIKRILVQT
jgi:uncharacterized protein (UPF0332 family)